MQASGGFNIRLPALLHSVSGICHRGYKNPVSCHVPCHSFIVLLSIIILTLL